MRILLTGSSGFIGSELFKQLREMVISSPLEEDITLTCTQRGCRKSSYELYRRYPHFGPSTAISHKNVELTDKFQVEQLMEEVRPDIIFHLAANPLVKTQDVSKLIESNFKLTEYLTSFAPYGCTFVFASSATVYGGCKLSSDAQFREEDLPNPSSIYAASKLASEALIQAKHNLGHLKGLICRLVANVGVGATHGILRDFIKKAQSDNPIFEILGVEGCCKPFMHVSDSCAALLELTFKKRIGIFNISPNDSLYVRDIANLVMGHFGVRKEIKFLWYSWPGDDRLVKVSPYKLLRSGWQPRYRCSIDAIKGVLQELSNHENRCNMDNS